MNQRYLSYLIVFLLFSLNFTICYLAITQSWDYGKVTFNSLFMFIALFIILERIIPYKGGWHPTVAEWKRDGLYLVFVIFAGAIGQGLVRVMALHLATPLGTMPLWPEVVLALLIATFGGYWFHRLGHVVPLLWRIHGIHHVPVKVNLANNSVVHPFDVIGSTICTQLPLLILGFSEESMFITGMMTMMLGYFIHANIHLQLGWVNYMITTPESHRLHHSVDYEEAGHYGTDLALWDLVFRSFTWYDSRAPKAVGVKDSLTFPLSESVLENAIHPFRRVYHRTLDK